MCRRASNNAINSEGGASDELVSCEERRVQNVRSAGGNTKEQRPRDYMLALRGFLSSHSLAVTFDPPSYPSLSDSTPRVRFVK